MTTSVGDCRTIISKLRKSLDELSKEYISTGLFENDNNSNDRFDENDPESRCNEHYAQQIQRLHTCEESMAELRIILTDHFVQESKNSVASMVGYIIHIIKNHCETTETVYRGAQMLRNFVRSIAQSIIQPSDYGTTISEYISLQNSTVKYFVKNFRQTYPESYYNKEELHRIEQAWNWNERTDESIFLGGAARPLLSERVTNFSELLSSYYNKLDPLYMQNRSNLFDVLYRLVREEGEKYWKNYDLFPSASSKGIIEQCLLYFYFRDRNNTFFINSSGSDYIPFVHLAQRIFQTDRFVGSCMTDPDDHNTKWILAKLTEECKNISNRMNKSRPLIIILLTSKNRFGARIDVDRIHHSLTEQFPGMIVTLVDACQDGQSFQDVDVIIYSKRFTTTGAIGLLSKRLTKEHCELRKSMMLGTNFPVSILAQVYSTVNMMNTNIAFGVEDLVNSANWYDYTSPVLKELRSVFGLYQQQENSPSSIKITEKNDVQFEFTEDETGTIVTIRLLNRENEDESLSRLMSKLSERRHTLDSFLMNDPLSESRNTISTAEVAELIENKDLARLRAIEARCSAHLAWPLVPFSAVKSSDDLITQEHFSRCQSYHRCLRISIDRSGYPGKLKRFVHIIHQILDSSEVTDAIVDPKDFKRYAPQWPSRE